MSYSRSPRALRSITVGIRGTARTLPLGSVGHRGLRQPGKDGGAREAPFRADSPAWQLAFLGERRDQLGLDLEQLRDALEREHVRPRRAERVPPELRFVAAHHQRRAT